MAPLWLWILLYSRMRFNYWYTLTSSSLFRTGYVSIREANKQLLGEEITEKTGSVYGLDDEGELRASYRPSGQPGVRQY